MVTTYTAIEKDEQEEASLDIEKVLGRQAISLEQLLEEYIEGKNKDKVTMYNKVTLFLFIIFEKIIFVLFTMRESNYYNLIIQRID